MAKKIDTSSLSRSSLQKAGHELKHNPPKILAHTARKFGKARAQKQRVAVLLSKAGRSQHSRRR